MMAPNPRVLIYTTPTIGIHNWNESMIYEYDIKASLEVTPHRLQITTTGFIEERTSFRRNIHDSAFAKSKKFNSLLPFFFTAWIFGGDDTKWRE